ncbi:MAG: ADP-ribosylation factor-like protein [Candidatus Odinarchaeota archaeon]
MEIKKLSDLIEELKFEKKLAKLVVAGDGNTGKTSIIQVLTEGMTLLDRQKGVTAYKKTPFLNIQAYRIQTAKSGPVKLQIYDLAGQNIPAHPLEVLDNQLMINLDVCLLVFSLDNYQSLMNIAKWFKQIKDYLLKYRLHPPYFLLVGNKLDLVSSSDLGSISQICDKIIKENEYFKHYFFVSSLTGEGLEKLFKDVYRYLFARYDFLSSI